MDQPDFTIPDKYFKALESAKIIKLADGNEYIRKDVVKEYADKMVQEQRDLMATYLNTHFNMRNVPKPKFKL